LFTLGALFLPGMRELEGAGVDPENDRSPLGGEPHHLLRPPAFVDVRS